MHVRAGFCALTGQLLRSEHIRTHTIHTRRKISSTLFDLKSSCDYITLSFPKMSFIKPTNYDVYTGFWVNTRHGQMHGSTLTLDRQDGALFIAFLALYVGLAGQGTWRIVRFLLHRAYSSTKTPDGIYNQRQAILRNSESGYSAALEMIQLCFVWRKREAWKIWIRMLPLMGLSLLLSLAFAVAGEA